jgi:hypothetical protein
MTVLAATTTVVAILSYLAAIACGMAFFLISFTRYLRSASRFEGTLLTFSAALAKLRTTGSGPR